MKVQIINKSQFNLPQYATVGASGLDLRASFTELDETFKGSGWNINKGKNIYELWLRPGGRILILTDIYVDVPTGYEFQVRARSGLAINSGIMMVNGIGTIDKDYKGNIGIILYNGGDNTFIIKPGDRIAQLVLCKVEKVEWNEVEKLSSSDRSTSGYGSTGV